MEVRKEGWKEGREGGKEGGKERKRKTGEREKGRNMRGT